MNTINTIFQEPTKENIKEFLTQWITTIPRHVKYEHGLCIAKLGEILKNNLIIILEKTEEYILIYWKPYCISIFIYRLHNRLSYPPNSI